MPTRRERIIELLALGKYTPKDLAKLLEIKVNEVLDDLEHVQKTLGKKLTVIPAFCSSCDYTFDHRKRLNTPSRCPECKAERVSGPWFTIEEEAEGGGRRAEAKSKEDNQREQDEHTHKKEPE